MCKKVKEKVVKFVGVSFQDFILDEVSEWQASRANQSDSIDHRCYCFEPRAGHHAHCALIHCVF